MVKWWNGEFDVFNTQLAQIKHQTHHSTISPFRHWGPYLCGLC
jgi:hypothetical protein